MSKFTDKIKRYISNAYNFYTRELPKKINRKSTKSSNKRIINNISINKEKPLITFYKSLKRQHKDKEINDLKYLTAVIWGEARGEPQIGKIAVGWVIKNRLKLAQTNPRYSYFGTTLIDVIKKQKQFTSINSTSVQRLLKNFDKRLETDNTVYECFKAAENVYYNVVGDPTHGATHYYSVIISKPPYWASKMIKINKIGKHVFYKLKNV